MEYRLTLTLHRAKWWWSVGRVDGDGRTLTVEDAPHGHRKANAAASAGCDALSIHVAKDVARALKPKADA